MPAWFLDEKERDYWHEAQDIAYRAGVSIMERDGCSWLVEVSVERMICGPAERLWYETWKILKSEFPRLTRQWDGGRAITKPGEMR